MTTLNFPSSPATGNVYSFGGKTWVYNGTAWDIQTSQLTTANVAEAIPNLYFTNTRAQLALQPTIAELRSSITAPCANVIYVSKNGNDNNTGHTEGNALANIHIALGLATEWTTVFVKSGDYILHNQPVTIKRRVGLVGDNLRTTTIRPEQPAVDLFYVNNACYVTGFTFRGHIAPAAVFSYNPDGSAGTIVTSPYIQNSSSITTTGTGMRVDGRYVSGLRSMVCDSYTQTNEGGIGIHMLNRGYTQLVSVFTICCHIAIKCESGGFCSITNSNASFGTYALYADGVSEPLYYGKLKEDTLGQEFTFTNLSKRPNYGDSVLFAEYNQAKCERDTGLIVDSLAFDLAYGGNSQSNFAGLQYWSQSESAIPNQSVETIAAINYAKSLAMNVVANIRVTSTRQVSNVQQFASAPTLIADAASNAKIANEFDLITSIISNGTTGVTDLIVPNSYPANTNAYVNHASNLLYRNNAFISSEVVAYVNNTYPTFTYNANTCARDVGFILDTIRFDLLHGGNKQAIQAGTYYYNYNASVTQINNQAVQTGAAYNYIGRVITNVITKNKNAGYNQDKCERDTGLIVDSILMDLAYGSNSQSIFAGLQYWAQSESAIPNQSEETVAAITYARNVARTISTDTLVSNLQANVAQVRGTAGGSESYGKITSEFDLIIDIINNGTVGVTDRIIPNSFPANTTIGINNGANLIYSNKSFIAAEVIAYVNQTYPGFFANASNFIDAANAQTKCARDVGYMIDSVRFDMMHDGNRQAIQAGTYYYNYNSNVTQINDQIVKTGQAYDYIAQVAGQVVQNKKNAAYNQDKCERDTGLIVDSLAFDLAYSGNSQATFAGLQYWSQTESAIKNQSTETIAAINYAKNLASNVIKNVTITSPRQGNVAQVTGSGASPIEANIFNSRFDLITGIITNGTVGVTDSIIPNQYPRTSNTTVSNGANLIIANKSFIAAEVIAYVNQTYPGFFANASKFVDAANASATCSRDVGYILDSITFDLLHGGNKQSIQAGTYYYNYNANVTQINDQIVKTGQAYYFIGSMIGKIILGNVIAPTYQTVISQNTTAASAATISEVSREADLVSLINTIITNGPNITYAKTPISLTANTDPNVINATKLILANRDFIKAETIAYVNRYFFDPPYQTDVSQNTTAYSAATVAEANIILNKVDIIKNIITNGPSVAPAKIPISYSPITNANLSNAAKILLLNKDYIKAETIAYVNAVLFDPPYQTDIKQNTTAAPASTYATANLILQNVGLITNIIIQGPSVAAAKLPIGLTANTDPNVINATKLILANRDYIKAETIAFVNRSWSSISNGSGTYYTVKNATPLVGNTSTVTLLETVFTPILANTTASFHQGSYISSSGHTFEYVGAGDTIATALPYLGGIPIQENEITELRGGKVFFTSTDQRGDFRIGTGLVINRVDGTISGRTFNKALFAVMTPYMLAIEG
jgi:16S rRNA G966 N2-methylase RsmD